jgi:epsilon-lactone hydrolase
MPSEAMQKLSARLKQSRVRPGQTVAWHRANFEAMSQTFRLPADVAVTPDHVAGVPCEWIAVPEAHPDRVCLYLHGGGYVTGGPITHRELAGRYGRALGARTLLVDYRLAPEHPCPAALEDAAAVHCELLAQGIPPESLVLCGESAGGGLAIALLTRLVSDGVPRPACAAVVSPWVDLTFSGRSYVENRDADPLVVYEVIEEYRAWVTAARPPDDPLVSPVFGNLDGLPPMFVAASADEILRDDALLLIRRLQEAGVEVARELRDGAIHAWTLFPHVPEAGETIAHIASFVAEHSLCDTCQ